jgi:hypothetical protein
VIQARNAAAWQLRLGQLLEALGRLELFCQLGFSSLAAYALERCERSARWVEAARCVARRLEQLPMLRRALATGRLSWSVAELVSGVASVDDEARWLALAQGCTVRELRQHVRGLRLEAIPRQPVHAEASALDESCTLRCTANSEDVWLLEATQTLLEHLGTRGQAAQLEALLAEGQEALLAALPRGALNLDFNTGAAGARRRWCEQLARWQAEAEQHCEGLLRSSLLEPLPARLSEVSAAAAAGLSSLQLRSVEELDAEVRALSRTFTRHELELSRCLLQFHRANGWRALGYATESQYARERLGLSRSLLLARRALALRLEALPIVAEALGSGQIGVEAGQQLVRIATPCTQVMWLERARQRTVKHLREEVSAALIAVRVSGEADCPPPEEPELEAYAALQQAVISGRICEPASVSELPVSALPARSLRLLVPPESPARRAWLVMLASLERWLAGGLMGSLEVKAEQVRAEREVQAEAEAKGEGRIQMSAEGPPRCARQQRSVGRVVLRWRVSRDVYEWWHALQSQTRAWLRPGVSWLRFLCLAFWQAWRHVLGAPVEYGGIYLRDGYQCRSPVCGRRDVTPHHLRFRSGGGGDEPENVASVCSWCHLFGIHGGRIRAQGTTDCIHWELGPVSRPCVIVHGRDRVAV